MKQFEQTGHRISWNLAGKIGAIAIGAFASGVVGVQGIAPAQAAITEKTPYYMCFAYTQDGMLFAGGDFDLRRARKLVAANCNVPKTMTVVLLRTIIVRRNGKNYSYEVPEHSAR